MSLNPPYRAADRQFTVPSELLAVQGMTPKLYAMLEPLVTALPATGLKININTAPEMVLRSISAQVDDTKLRQFLDSRKDKPSTNPQDPTVRDIFGTDAVPYGVTSKFFQIQGEVVVGSSRVGLYSLIYRDKGNQIVLAHSADAE
jgi:general secretion pathway protein K